MLVKNKIKTRWNVEKWQGNLSLSLSLCIWNDKEMWSNKENIKKLKIKGISIK